MSENKRSFFSTIPGLVTGLAGLLTGIVGLVTVLIQLNVIGGDDSNGSTAVNAGGPVTSAPAGGGGGGATPTTEAGSFTVSPSPLNFGPADPKEKTLTVKNTSSTARLTVQTPRVTGKDAERFSTSSDCSGSLAPNLSCNVRVTFAPSGPLRTYEATIQVQATGAPRGAEVKVTASTLLG
ncbi:MAG: hypothetical protein M3450_05235 [Actinomycetota bacterium]|nr:hypothetical protein [Actinomycetota bacterium]